MLLGEALNYYLPEVCRGGQGCLAGVKGKDLASRKGCVCECECVNGVLRVSE